MDLQSVSQLLGGPVEIRRVAEGHSNTVYIVESQSGNLYVVRDPKDDFAAELAKRGAVILRHIKSSVPSLPVPEAVREDSTRVALSFLEGKPLRVWNHKVLGESRRHRILRDLAGALWKIWTCPAAPIQQGKSLTYREWLLEEVDKGILRSLDYEGWGDPIHFLFRRARIDSLVPLTDNEKMAIRHGKMSAFKILVNEGGLTGIIGWDWAKIVPLPAAVQHPDFIADTPGYINEGVDEYMTFEDDRRFFEGEIRRLSDESTVAGAQRVPALLETSLQRRFFELSLRIKRVNAEWCRLAGDVPKLVALEQLQAFITTNPESEDYSKIKQLRARLEE